jgi:Ni/Fe-hydrogenase subunit HybB-like protein
VSGGAGALPLGRGALRAERGGRDLAWWVPFLVCAAGTLLLLALIVYTVLAGIGLWGDHVPVAWGITIANFAWWGHAGAMISALLLLTGSPLRPALGRLSETMALCSLAVAGIFPLLHLGRPWFFYWLVPYPGSLGVWPQFRSALTWDVVGILSLLAVSFLFFHAGAVPALARARDGAEGRMRRRLYGLLALGWKGSGREWLHHHRALRVLAVLVVAAAVSMHSIASLDFATGILPGWHTTLLPAAFLIRSLFTGAALLLLLAVLLRPRMGAVEERHLDALAKAVLAGCWLVAYTWVAEVFFAWYAGDVYLRHTYLWERPAGPFALLTWSTAALVLLAPQAFWARAARRSDAARIAVALAVLAGMWLERYLVVVTSLTRGFLPSAWRGYQPTWVEWGIFAGSVALFGFLLLLVVRFVPLVDPPPEEGR